MLNPSVTRETSRRRAETQECLGLKPCWETRVSRTSRRNGRSRRSNIFTAGHSKEIGRNEALSVRGLPSFKIGIKMELFQMEGSLIPASKRLKSSVRMAKPDRVLVVGVGTRAITNRYGNWGPFLISYYQIILEFI